jgi:hypothetical protein
MAAIELDTPSGQSARTIRTVIAQGFEQEAAGAPHYPAEGNRSICESIELFHVFKVPSPYQMPTRFASAYLDLPEFWKKRRSTAKEHFLLAQAFRTKYSPICKYSNPECANTCNAWAASFTIGNP